MESVVVREDRGLRGRAGASLRSNTEPARKFSLQPLPPRPSPDSPPPATGWPSLGAGGPQDRGPLCLPVHRGEKRGLERERGCADGSHLIPWGELVKNMNDGERERERGGRKQLSP